MWTYLRYRSVFEGFIEGFRSLLNQIWFDDGRDRRGKK